VFVFWSNYQSFTSQPVRVNLFIYMGVFLFCYRECIRLSLIKVIRVKVRPVERKLNIRRIECCTLILRRFSRVMCYNVTHIYEIDSENDDQCVQWIKKVGK
jgi:hypothetical protein